MTIPPLRAATTTNPNSETTQTTTGPGTSEITASAAIAAITTTPDSETTTGTSEITASPATSIAGLDINTTTSESVASLLPPQAVSGSAVMVSVSGTTVTSESIVGNLDMPSYSPASAKVMPAGDSKTEVKDNVEGSTSLPIPVSKKMVVCVYLCFNTVLWRSLLELKLCFRNLS